MQPLSVLVLMLGFSLPAAAKQETYIIDSEHAYPSFELSHLGFSIQRGTFDQTSGRITFDPVAKRGSVEVTVQTASIDTGHDQRDKNLKGEEFFNVTQFPTMRFASDTFHFEGDKLTRVEGELTLLGVTRPLSLTASHFACGKNSFVMKLECGAELTGTLKRSDFGMNAYVPAVGDEVTLHIQVEAFKKTETHKPK